MAIGADDYAPTPVGLAMVVGILLVAASAAVLAIWKGAEAGGGGGSAMALTFVVVGNLAVLFVFKKARLDTFLFGVLLLLGIVTNIDGWMEAI